MLMKLMGIISVDDNRSTTDRIFCIYQILEKNGTQWGSTSAIHRLKESL